MELGSGETSACILAPLPSQLTNPHNSLSAHGEAFRAKWVAAAIFKMTFLKLCFLYFLPKAVWSIWRWRSCICWHDISISTAQVWFYNYTSYKSVDKLRITAYTKIPRAGWWNCSKSTIVGSSRWRPDPGARFSKNLAILLTFHYDSLSMWERRCYHSVRGNGIEAVTITIFIYAAVICSVHPRWLPFSDLQQLAFHLIYA